MSFPILFLLCLLTSCASNQEPAPIDWAWVRFSLLIGFITWLASKAGYYEGLAKGRKAQIQAMSDITLEVTENPRQAAMRLEGFKPSLNTERLAKIMHDQWTLVMGDGIHGVLLWDGKFREADHLKECNAWRAAASRVVDIMITECNPSTK